MEAMASAVSSLSGSAVISKRAVTGSDIKETECPFVFNIALITCTAGPSG